VDTDALVNKGCIIIPGRHAEPGEERTFIVSGLGRGGTTMLASVLREAGLFIGERLEPISAEDVEIWAALKTRDRAWLERLIASRNAAHSRWGFKLPEIPAYLTQAELGLFRNPHLILVIRDPVAVAVRGSIAEFFDPVAGLRESILAIRSILEFAGRAGCPTLLQSYEKTLIFPGAFVDALARFCGFAIDPPLRERLIETVRPNEERYRKGARRRFAGAIDLVADGVLHGWCAELGAREPVAIDLLVDGRVAGTYTAGEFRNDLLAAGYGNGTHGFAIDLVPLGLSPEAVIRVRVSGRTFELSKGGRTLAQLTPEASPDEATRRAPEPALPAPEPSPAPI
jgi:hypothetical protein